MWEGKKVYKKNLKVFFLVSITFFFPFYLFYKLLFIQEMLSLLFSSQGYQSSSYKQQQLDREGNHIPTYITISPRKDGATAKTKCLNPQRTTSSSRSTLLPLKRKLKTSSSSLSAKFRVRGSFQRRRSSSRYSINSSNSNLQQSDIIRSSTYKKKPIVNLYDHVMKKTTTIN